MRTGVPGARLQYNGFGRGFYKNPNTLTARHTTNIERASGGEYRHNNGGVGPASAVVGAAGVRWHKEIAAGKRSGGLDGKVGGKPSRRMTVAPTLLQVHQRVIDAALLEISRPRERPFENLGERLGGEHETFTYSSQDGSEGTNPESAACDPTRLPEAATPKRRASTATGKRRALVRSERPRPSTRPSFSTLTADGPRQIDLPRCNEPWKIPLLRTSWTPSNASSRRITDDSLGNTGCDLLSYEEGAAGVAARSAEEDTAKSKPAAGASTHLDGVKELENIGRPCAQSTAPLPIESMPVSRIAASQYVEEIVSNVLLTSLLEADSVGNQEVQGQAHPKSDALSWDGASVVDGPVSCTVAKQYVEETVSHALRGAFLVVSGKENLSMKASRETQRDGARSRDQVTIASESKVVARECSRKYLQQGLQARLVGASGEGASCSQKIQVDTPVRMCLPKINGHLTETMSPVSAQQDAFGKGCHISGESGATTPSSGITSRMSSESSSIEFVLNDDSSAGTWHGDEIVLDHHGGTGDGNSCSSARVEALTIAATAAVEQWVSSVVSTSARANTQQTPAGVKTSPSLIADKRAIVQGAGDAACDGKPSECCTDTPEVGINNRQPGSPLGGAMKMLPLGFLEDIVQRRVSLKPVLAARPTSASVENDGRLELDSRQQRELCAQDEATERACVLRELETLARAEGLDRYDPGAFSRGMLYGEGRHSVVYSAYAARPFGNEQKQHGEDMRGAASTAVMIRHAAAAKMAREASVEILTMAVAAGVTTKAVSSLSTIPMIVSIALTESVIPASISAVLATTLEKTKTVLAAKEFRYARADVPVSILRQAHREALMHLRVSGCTHVVALRGVWLTPRVTLLLEPMGGGTLYHFVRQRAAEEKARNDESTGGRVEDEQPRTCTPSVEAAWLVAEAAEGLAALHSAGVVHRDVKSHNVMVVKRQQGTTESTKFMPGLEAKLGDLGSATLVPPEAHTALLTEETGTSGWMAPEVILMSLSLLFSSRYL